MNPIGKIAKEIGEEVAEKITKEPLKWGFKGRKPTDIKDLNYEDLEAKIAMGYRDIKNQRIINNEYNKVIKGSEKNKTLKKYVDYDNNSDSAVKKAWKLGAINNRFKDLENIGVPRELTGKVLGSRRMTHEFDKLDDINPRYFYPDFEYYSTARKEYKKYLNKWKKSLLRYYNELDDKQKETFDALSDEWEGSTDELIDVVKSL